MIRIKKLNGTRVIKDSLGFLKSDAMFLLVNFIFLLIPNKPNAFHW